MKCVFVYGDVSFKNILVGLFGLVLFDVEIVWYGDLVFDLVFCLNYLVIKVCWFEWGWVEVVEVFDCLVEVYFVLVDWELCVVLEVCVVWFLFVFVLVCVDGKLLVEYLDDVVCEGLCGVVW